MDLVLDRFQEIVDVLWLWFDGGGDFPHDFELGSDEIREVLAVDDEAKALLFGRDEGDLVRVEPVADIPTDWIGGAAE